MEVTLHNVRNCDYRTEPGSRRAGRHARRGSRSSRSSSGGRHARLRSVLQLQLCNALANDWMVVIHDRERHRCRGAVRVTHRKRRKSYSFGKSF